MSLCLSSLSVSLYIKSVCLFVYQVSLSLCISSLSVSLYIKSVMSVCISSMSFSLYIKSVCLFVYQVPLSLCISSLTVSLYIKSIMSVCASSLSVFFVYQVCYVCLYIKCVFLFVYQECLPLSLSGLSVSLSIKSVYLSQCLSVSSVYCLFVFMSIVYLSKH